MNATLYVTPDGRVQGRYTDAIALTTLGRLRVDRATTIEFDHFLQVWRVFNPRGHCLYVSPSRDKCLAWEHRYLDSRQEQALEED